MKPTLLSLATETLQGVFHANNWGQEFSEDLLETLIEEAKINLNRKARLCLHPNPNEPLQVTYLAFCSPYSDKIHSHPHRAEVLVPIIGKAKHTTFDSSAMAVSSKVIDGRLPIAISTAKGVWHAVEVITPSFVMIEIGTGPFLKDSTVFLQTPEV
jgi:cupin fold WbuC family metalloprotein